jgi:Cupin-like domain
MAIPGHSTAPELESVQASTLTEKRFRRQYVDEWRPCRIVGAINHWPAMRLWASREYLISKIGADREVDARTHPRIGHVTRQAQTKQNADTMASMSFSEFLRRASAPECGNLVLQSYAIRNEITSQLRHPFAPAQTTARRHNNQFEHRSLPWLGADVDGFYFMTRARLPRAYPAYRTFIFRNSYTDWHWHATDETLMCQVLGAKDALLLPPDETSWSLLTPIMEEHGRTFEHDFSDAFARADLSKLRRVVLEPGDALYIPPYWWHSVEALEESMGITVAACWGCDLTARGSGDLRYPAARQIIGDLLRGSNAASFVPNAAMIAVAVGSSYARRCAQVASRRAGNRAIR